MQTHTLLGQLNPTEPNCYKYLILCILFVHNFSLFCNGFVLQATHYPSGQYAIIVLGRLSTEARYKGNQLQLQTKRNHPIFNPDPIIQTHRGQMEITTPRPTNIHRSTQASGSRLRKLRLSYQRRTNFPLPLAPGPCQNAPGLGATSS